jgi:hypothetical protein
MRPSGEHDEGTGGFGGVEPCPALALDRRWEGFAAAPMGSDLYLLRRCTFGSARFANISPTHPTDVFEQGAQQ